MNTIKFSPILDERKEVNNVEIYDVKELIIDNKKYEYYSNAQISLYITKKCNGKCPFCMNIYENRFCQSKELNDKDYFKSLENLLNNFKDIKPPITITGGEATKSKRLVKTLKMIKEKGFRIRTFSTNGTGLFDLYEGRPIINHLLENGVVNNINLSRMAIDEKENETMMGIKLNNRDISKIFTYAHINNMDIRLSCIIQKDGVKDLKDILDFHDFYDRIGIDTVMFRELIDLDNAAYKERVIDIKPIFKEIEENNDFKLLRVLEGMYYIVKIYRYKDKIVKCYQEKELIHDKDVIREFVFYPDGNLDKGWNKENNVILRSERSDNDESI